MTLPAPILPAPTLPPPFGPPPEPAVEQAEEYRPRWGTIRLPRRLEPGWPVTAILVFFPVWWALGLGELIFPILAIPMIRHLLRRRPIKLPRGFALWALFLVWTVAGIVMLGVNPAGTVHGTVQGRSIGYGMRVVQFLAMTVLLVYIGNLRESELSRLRIVRMLGIFFLVATAGGLLGTLFPYFAFSSPLELVLPAGIRSNSYVQSLVHPAAAQVQDVLGYAAPRPKAPFDYTNSWGNNMAVLGVWFVCGWWALGRFRRRLAAAAVLAVAAVPVIYSLNRGMWIGVGLAVAYVGIRLALRGRPIVLLSMAVAVAAVVLLVLLSPLGGVIHARLDNPRSNDIRANLSEQAVQVTAGSPIVGYGTTRTALGSPQSIAVGRTSSCQRCGNFVIGSNGQLFQLLITVGYGGAALYFGFFLFVVWRYGRDPTPIGMAGTLVVLLTIFFSLFYNVLSSPLALTMVSVGLLWRNEQARYARVRD